MGPFSSVRCSEASSRELDPNRACSRPLCRLCGPQKRSFAEMGTDEAIPSRDRNAEHDRSSGTRNQQATDSTVLLPQSPTKPTNHDSQQQDGLSRGRRIGTPWYRRVAPLGLSAFIFLENCPRC